MMAEVTTASPAPVSIVAAAEAKAATIAATEESKVLAFAKAHVSKLISAGVGFGVAKLHVFGLLWKLI